MIFDIFIRILEQHNKEVNEMDHLLQEELQQAKATQQQSVSIMGIIS